MFQFHNLIWFFFNSFHFSTDVFPFTVLRSLSDNFKISESVYNYSFLKIHIGHAFFFLFHLSTNLFFYLAVVDIILMSF